MDRREHDLVALANTRMPFGKYAGRHLVRLPDGRTKMAAWIEGSHLVRE